mmetsp:Transcript_543/g.821  ORF Transcript_543/g.821 Transcript_543/m.821 type:complete len:325 (-) Transcript_543:73-1047(-)|eukprot:CAMPEP_0194216674 /NCGR_PEP_ID=MMETSP0156-20130528/19484_1 /TAXON_ID=33649 /ORGANISM="Thalassionema nitzschioides, Strain L26-B" /LENGTH=324 /DNA_ID=CAMNT_0038945499 /DNA_START=62 /DNA_END=1036 /DNA_ORIENTATION=-
MASLLLPASNATGSCDRRMSRAARTVLMEQVAPFLENWLREEYNSLPRPTRLEPPTRKKASSQAPNYLWKLLQMTITDNGECPLKNDIFQHFEQQSLVGLPRNARYVPRYPHHYHCGICGKVFSSQYYLDRHQFLQHSEESTSSFCWADYICSALGGCEKVALDVEPYYGRGSGPDGSEARPLQRMWAQQQGGCNDSYVAIEMKANCEDLFQTCFEGSLRDALLKSLCEPLSCHSLFHREQLMHRHLSMSLWQEHSRWKNPSSVGCLVVVVVVAFYLVKLLCKERGTNGGKKIGNRLLTTRSTQKRKQWATRLIPMKLIKHKRL